LREKYPAANVRKRQLSQTAEVRMREKFPAADVRMR
jgi:hypothetical protein